MVGKTLFLPYLRQKWYNCSDDGRTGGAAQESLTVFIFTADYGKTCRGRRHIVSPCTQLVLVWMSGAVS